MRSQAHRSVRESSTDERIMMLEARKQKLLTQRNEFQQKLSELEVAPLQNDSPES
jgi:hypothetical protein